MPNQPGSATASGRSYFTTGRNCWEQPPGGWSLRGGPSLTAELLPRGGRQESGGGYLPAVTIFSALKRMLGDDRMRTNGLMLIQRIAKLSGSLTQDYRPTVLQGLSKELDFPLKIDGASKGAWDNIVVTRTPNHTHYLVTEFPIQIAHCRRTSQDSASASCSKHETTSKLL